MKKLRVLVACEFSGVVRQAFRKRGHDAWSCDLLPTEIPGAHYQGDVRKILLGYWDLLIAFPPCTRLCNSGVRWLAERDLWKEMYEAVDFFNMFIRSKVKRVSIENPIMHKYARDMVIRPYSQIIQPYQFGHKERKQTCLWLKNLPPLMPVGIQSERLDRVHREPPGPERSKNRSRTFQGIADAMADQWGRLA